MQSTDLSLFHQARSPHVVSLGKPPLLLMLHSIFSNEEELMTYADRIDDRFCVVSARAPIAVRKNGYAWFPMKFKLSENNFLLRDVETCRLLLMRFIDEVLETYNADPEQVYVMGFSQGAVMGYSLALTVPDRLAGVVAISGRISEATLQQMYEEDLVDARSIAHLPIFIAHGVKDPVIPIQYGRATRSHLQDLAVPLDYREYETGHTVTPQMIEDSSVWLSSRLPLDLRQPATLGHRG